MLSFKVLNSRFLFLVAFFSHGGIMNLIGFKSTDLSMSKSRAFRLKTDILKLRTSCWVSHHFHRVMWSNGSRFTPPSSLWSGHTDTHKNTNTFSLGGRFNYSAFSLQITQEHLGLGEQSEWCKESDDGIRWIPMVLLELDLLSLFPRGKTLPPLKLSCFGFLLAGEMYYTLTYHLMGSDS